MSAMQRHWNIQANRQMNQPYAESGAGVRCPKCGSAMRVGVDRFVFSCDTCEPAPESPEQIRARQEKAFAEADIGTGPMQSESAEGKEAVILTRVDAARVAELESQCEQLKRDLADETNIVDRVWKALGIHTYEQSKPLAIWEHVSNLRADVLRLKQELDEVITAHCHDFAAARREHASRLCQIKELAEDIKGSLACEEWIRSRAREIARLTQ